MCKKLAIILFVTVLWNTLSCTANQANISDYYASLEQSEATRAQRVMTALFRAYPGIIEKLEFRNGDWAILIRGSWFYYAGGRILPEDKLENAENYRPLLFYGYPAELPQWRDPRPEEVERYRNWTNRGTRMEPRSHFFLDALWLSTNQEETENQLVEVSFLGWSPMVHELIQKQLKRVDAEIMAAARTRPQVREWIENIGLLDGYNWRNIAGTVIRSPHSYGKAIDILPKSLEGKHTYWLWSVQNMEDWWNVPYEERFHPPASVIKAFERHGFIWGGKWPLFDTMHFEYRPEVLEMNNMPLKDLRELR
jgi:hypothetical protein